MSMELINKGKDQYNKFLAATVKLLSFKSPDKCVAKWLSKRDRRGPTRCENFQEEGQLCTYHAEKKRHDCAEYSLLKQLDKFDEESGAIKQKPTLIEVLRYAKYFTWDERRAWCAANEYVLRHKFQKRYFAYWDDGHHKRVQILRAMFHDYFEVDEDEDGVFRIIKKASLPPKQNSTITPVPTPLPYLENKTSDEIMSNDAKAVGEEMWDEEWEPENKKQKKCTLL